MYGSTVLSNQTLHDHEPSDMGPRTVQTFMIVCCDSHVITSPLSGEKMPNPCV